MSQQSLAYLYPEFLESAEGRPVRILAEYLEPLRRFREHKIQDTVVFFGSSRVYSGDRARHALQALDSKRALGTDPGHEEELKKVRKAVEWARYYEDARTLAHQLTTWSRTLQSENHRFVVTSGGGAGIMEAANRGASEAGGKTIGLNIRLPYEQEPNRYISDELHFEFRYFFMRKFWFAYLAAALVVFPGGFGTCDELFEFLTLSQTDKLSKRTAVVLYGREYWDQILNLGPMSEWGAIGPRDLSLIHHANSPEEAFEHLREHLIAHHLEPKTEQETLAPGIAKTRG